MPEERRNDAELKVIAERLDNLVHRHECAETLSAEWRLRYDLKVDKIVDKLNNLPCDVRIEGTKGIKQNIRALWLVTGGMVLAIISEWVKMK